MPFPADDYTPHGYLDQPAHTRNLSPRGVLRSFDAGFRWHFPAHAGMYGGRRETYRAGFRVGLDGAFALADYDQAASPYHSKNIVDFVLARGLARLAASFHPAGEHALRAELRAEGAATIDVHLEYARLLSANGEWGESGLVGRLIDAGLLLQGFEDGHAFLLWLSRPPRQLAVGPDLATAAPLPPAGFVNAIGRRGELVALHGRLSFDAGAPLELILARGRSEAEARATLAEARLTAAAERERLRAADDAFWARAPQLSGDWPAHWRRGLVYDQETLRMMVRQPAGIYRHVWDAMQIQAPRVVLAEAAIDALLLSYADPALAQALLLGTFADAPAPNVPCSREDGSYNMLAADGTVCGTGPQWGYPFLVAAWLYDARPDPDWLAAIYPRLAAYLAWWLDERADGAGWLGFACSWESGQDDSPRFGDQPLGGGHPVRHVRPVDLHAALAHAARVLERFAGILGEADEQPRWRGLAAELAARTEQLWHAGRYADFDARAGAFTEVDDVMLLAPLALGLAPAERAADLARSVAALDADTLTWPMFAWTAVEAAAASGDHARAAELAAAVCERAYSFWDARRADPARTLPGVACEYWPLSGRCGGEGYGWGAFTTHLALHSILGLSPAPDGLRLRPNLPPAWRLPGRRYGARLHWRGRPLAVELAPQEHGRVRVSVDGVSSTVAWGEQLTIAGP